MRFFQVFCHACAITTVMCPVCLSPSPFFKRPLSGHIMSGGLLTKLMLSLTTPYLRIVWVHTFYSTKMREIQYWLTIPNIFGFDQYLKIVSSVDWTGFSSCFCGHNFRSAWRNCPFTVSILPSPRFFHYQNPFWFCRRHSTRQRRRIYTESTANVVSSVWGADFIQFPAELAVLTRSIWQNGWIQLFLSTQPRQNS